MIGLNPVQAVRNALRMVTERGSDAPLLDAAELVLDAARTADPEDPAWHDFLACLNAAEVNAIETAQAGRRISRIAGHRRIAHV